LTRLFSASNHAIHRHARDLEFEQAAKLRDEIQRIRQFGLGLLGVKVG
jgi:excinuclease ABC subunit B